MFLFGSGDSQLFCPKTRVKIKLQDAAISLQEFRKSNDMSITNENECACVLCVVFPGFSSCNSYVSSAAAAS